MRKSYRLVFAALVFLSAGCAIHNNPVLSSGPVPRVEDCAQLQQATPTKYFCGGKTYTAVQLADIRNGRKSMTK